MGRGSFVEAKHDPADIDVLTMLSLADHDGLTGADRDLLYRLLDNEHCRQEFGCDVYPLATFPEGHPDHAGAEAMRDYWGQWWGHDRDGRAKGYLEGAARLEVTLGGAPVARHTVAAGFAGQFLDRLQSLMTSVAQALSEQVTLRAPVRREIAERAELRLTATARGSFRLLLNPPTPEQPTLLPEDDALLDRSVTAVLGVLRAAGVADGARSMLLDRALPLGDGHGRIWRACPGW